MSGRDAAARVDPVVVAAVRTPLGREGGAFAGVRSEDLSVAVVDALLVRTGVDPGAVDDFVWGCAQQRSEQAGNLARIVALLSDLGETVPGATVNRWAASSTLAITAAADAVRAGHHDAVIAGGVESMSRVPLGGTLDDLHPGLADRYDLDDLRSGTASEALARTFDVSREDQDAYALRSHRRAAETARDGGFDAEVTPVETDAGTVDADERIRPDITAERLASLSPAFESDGTVTAGNAAEMADGAAGVLVASPEFVADRGLDVLGRVGAHAVVGDDPTLMGAGAVSAVDALFDRADWSAADVDLAELNESSAAAVIHATRDLDVPDSRVNVNGGAIALGNPLGAAGARLAVTLLHEMARRDAGLGLTALCAGLGTGVAVGFERE